MEKKKNWFRRHWILTIIFIIIILGIIGSMVDTPAGGNDNSSIIDKNPSNNYNLNERIVIDNFAYTFTDMKTMVRIGSAYFGQEPNGVYLLFDVEVENIGNEADYINNEIYILDDKGREFSQEDSAWIYLDNNLIFEELNPGLIKKGQIIYDVPKDLNGKLGIKKNSWSSDFSAYISWN